MKRAVTLYELNQEIRSLIEKSLPYPFLITAEIASLDVRRHCYMNLVDKEGDLIRAEMRAVIWASRFRMISDEFRRTAGTDLIKGLRILFEASVRFHERYGLSLDIIRIDPSYTLGEMSAKRRAVLDRLEKEGLRERNRSLSFPLVPQRIGIVSSSAAAGYEDLINHLLHNPYAFGYSCRLYEAFMQGERAEGSIVKALRGCKRDRPLLDLVVIVRGGGGTADLHCFDSYEIGKAVALLDIPMISGIGHMRDNTVLDEVANMVAKTPTAVADLIITRTKRFSDTVDDMSNKLVREVSDLLYSQNKKLSYLARKFHQATADELQTNMQRLHVLIRGMMYARKIVDTRMRHIFASSAKMKALVAKDMAAQRNMINGLLSRIARGTLSLFSSEISRLDSRENSIDHLDPRNILKRGYSITVKNGKPLISYKDVKPLDRISTVLYDGSIVSAVEESCSDKGEI